MNIHYENIELDEHCGSVRCAYLGCKTLLVYGNKDGTVWDTELFWLEECKCYEEDRQSYCASHRLVAICEECEGK